MIKWIILAYIAYQYVQNTKKAPSATTTQPIKLNFYNQ